jgi:hypothetical protein
MKATLTTAFEPSRDRGKEQAIIVNLRGLGF